MPFDYHLFQLADADAEPEPHTRHVKRNALVLPVSASHNPNPPDTHAHANLSYADTTDPTHNTMAIPTHDGILAYAIRNRDGDT